MTVTLGERAVRLLARREHSRAELARKLAPHGSPEEIHAVLEQLQQSGSLSDVRYAESFVRSKAARFGQLKLRHELRARGVADEVIDAALGGHDEDDEARARNIWRRKFHQAPRDAAEYAKQARFLQSRGFSPGTVRKILKGAQ